MACIATPSLQQREVSMPGGGTDTGVAMVISASSTDLLDKACPRVAQRDKLKQRREHRITLDLASEQKLRRAPIIEPEPFKKSG